MKALYDNIGNGKYRCNICGKEIYWVGKGYGILSHARKHVREGKAVEKHVQSTRCYNGYDIEFYIKEV